MSEKLFLKWDEFQRHFISALGRLKEENEFADVTLACDDGQQIEAHKVILASSSQLFKDLLKGNKHPHPIIYMRGMKSEDLVSIIDFLYHGETKVCQENLDSFLTIAEDLKLEGVVGQSCDPRRFSIQELQLDKVKVEEPTNGLIALPEATIDKKPLAEYKTAITSENLKTVLPMFVSGDLRRLDEQVKTMMEKSENIVPNKRGEKAKICKVCGKEGEGTSIRNHIEAIHLEGVSLPCNICEKEFRSRLNSLERAQK